MSTFSGSVASIQLILFDHMNYLNPCNCYSCWLKFSSPTDCDFTLTKPYMSSTCRIFYFYVGKVLVNFGKVDSIFIHPIYQIIWHISTISFFLYIPG